MKFAYPMEQLLIGYGDLFDVTDVAEHVTVEQAELLYMYYDTDIV